MTAKPNISVIIPAYNTEKYIEQALRSALGQTLESIEVLLVDDASTDKTLAVAAQFKNDLRLRILPNPKNIGVSASRNRALSAATGNWVAVLDADDWYAPDRLETLLNVARNEAADIVADDLFLIRDGDSSPWGTLIGESGTPINDVSEVDLISFIKTDIYGKKGLRLGLSKPIFRRDFLLRNDIKYNENLTSAEDFWLDVECLLKGAKFVLLPKPFYFYRSRPGSLVQQGQLKTLNQYCRAAEQFLDRAIVRENPELVHAVSYNLKIFRRNRAYQRVIDPLKKKRWFQALIEMIKNPYFFIHLAFQFPSIIKRRIQYYIFENSSAFDMLSKQK